MDLRGKKSLLVYCYSSLSNFSTHENMTMVVAYADQVVHTDVFLLPHKITCPYKQTFPFLFRSLHRATRFLFTDTSHTGLLAHTGAF